MIEQTHRMVLDGVVINKTLRHGNFREKIF
jgi:hypothetical protein